MTTFLKAMVKKSDIQTNIVNYRVAANENYKRAKYYTNKNDNIHKSDGQEIRWTNKHCQM